MVRAAHALKCGSNVTNVTNVRKSSSSEGNAADKHYKFVMLIHEAELSESAETTG
jgi:hypothetical protein